MGPLLALAPGMRARHRRSLAAVALAWVLVGPVTAFAQVNPVSLTKIDDLDFGMLSEASAGTVVVDPNGMLTTTGGVAAQGGSPNAAAFNVTGDPDFLYDITLPESFIWIDGPGNKKMKVDSFTDSEGGTGTLVGGTDSFTVGATLRINNNQSAGAYSGSFDVTVAYQ